MARQEELRLAQPRALKDGPSLYSWNEQSPDMKAGQHRPLLQFTALDHGPCEGTIVGRSLSSMALSLLGVAWEAMRRKQAESHPASFYIPLRSTMY